MSTETRSAKKRLEEMSKKERYQLHDLAEHIGHQLAELAELAEQAGMYELQKKIEEADAEAGAYNMFL